MSFVNLYLKTEYSMLQSSCHLEKTFERLVEYGYDSVAMTDEGNLYGAIKFYRMAQKYHIKPILGLKLNYQYNGRTSSILLYAMNHFGYRNLMRLSSQYLIQHQTMELSDICNYSLGLLAIVPFSESSLFIDYKNNNLDYLFQHLHFIQDAFDQFYIGLKRQSSKERELLEDWYTLFQSRNYKMVALSKVSYLEEEDIEVYQTLKAIENGGVWKELFDGEEREWLYRPEEIEVLFQDYPDLIENTKVIASKCNVTIEFGHYQLPKYSEEIVADEYLRELCFKGLQKRLKQNQVGNVQSYYERLNYELDTIKETGFSDYFLIVWDFIKYAKSNRIYVGPGRGSAPASLVSYCLGITDIDPMHYHLLFERFLNKERITMPDIDTDFPDDTRDLVIRYVGEKYGKHRVAHIVTFGTFKVKLALRDVARVYQLSEIRLKEVMKCIQTFSTKELYSLSLQEVIQKSTTLLQLMEDYEDINQVVRIASKIEGLPRNTSTHAAGIIITRHDLVYSTPLDNGLDGIYQTQYEASDLEMLGLLKMDFLGLRNLTNIEKCIALIQEINPQFVLPKEMDDALTFQMIARGDVSGIFQLESAGMRKVLMDLKVSSFEDIAFALALYRPGPMDSIPHFIDRKFGREKIIYPHPDLESILKETYGMIVYQDQILLIARKFAGYSLGRADILRRAISKKKLEVLESERTDFVQSSIQQGYSKETAEEIYNYIVKFADYGFNKAHSVAYAKVSYLTAYLKCHYFNFYLATLLSSVIGSDTDIKLYYQEALKRGLKIVPPEINISRAEFTPVENGIVFPLSMIRGLGVVKVNELLQERAKGNFQNFEDFVKRTTNILGGSLIENVIYSGALDEFGLTKKAMIDHYQTIIDRMTYDFVSDYVPQNYDTEEFTYGELLEREKNILGMNLKYNFLNQYQGLYQTYQLLHIREIEEGRYIQTMGLIQNIKVIQTKKGETMAFMRLSDDVDSIELTLFPATYHQYMHIKIGQLAIVKGKAEKRKEIQIIVNEIKMI